MRIKLISLPGIAFVVLGTLGICLLMCGVVKWVPVRTLHMGWIACLFFMVVLGVARVAARMEQEKQTKEIIWANAAPAGAALAYALASFYDPKPSTLQPLLSVMGGTLCSNLTFIVSMAMRNRSAKPRAANSPEI